MLARLLLTVALGAALAVSGAALVAERPAGLAGAGDVAEKPSEIAQAPASAGSAGVGCAGTADAAAASVGSAGVAAREGVGSVGGAETAEPASLADPGRPADPQAEPPSWASWHARTYEADVTGDGTLDRLLVGDRRFELQVAGERGFDLGFLSPEAWLVSDASVADLDGDELPEVVLLVWRAANFGSSRPFWVEEPQDAQEFIQHVFVLGWQDGELRPRWMSSQTGVEIAAMAVDDDGLLVLTDRTGTRTGWRWGSWGFALEDESPEPVEQATMLVAGDVIGHEALLAAARDDEGGFDFGPVFAPVAELVAEADFAVVGQETPFVTDPALYGGYPYFGTPPALGEALVDAGFDGVLAANNHILDRDERGLTDTLAFWEAHPEVTLLGVRKAGEGKAGDPADRPASNLDSQGFSPTVVQVEGFRIALFNATYGTNGRSLPKGSPFEVDSLGMEAWGAAEASVPQTAADGPADGRVAAAGGTDSTEGDSDLDLEETSPQLEELLAQVADAQVRDDVDLVICFMHLGPEYGDEPSQAQRGVVQRLADTGADAVLCSHGHEVLGWERVTRSDGGACAVAWGLGNFAAVQDDLACMLGVCARLTLDRDAQGRVLVADIELVPTVTHVGRDGAAAVYPLADYTDELASEHYLDGQDHPVTVEGLWELYAERTALVAAR